MSVLAKTKRLFLSLGALFSALILSLGVLSTPVFADPAQNNTTTSENQSAENNSSENQTTSTSDSTTDEKSDDSTANVCYDEAGSLGWFVCPTTGFLSRIVDGLYDVISDLLVVKPLTTDSDSAFRQIWSVFRDITNVVFVIFFLVIIWSQVTGIGISNYGIKKLLPKIIVSAILINLSYIICAALVDVSNIAGASLKNVFTDIEQNITPTGLLAASGETLEFNYAGLLAAIVSGTLLTTLSVGAAGGIGYIFISLLPVLLGAVVAIVIAFLTIASRQAFVYLLIMVSPLAFVCNLLPNTETWFSKWKQALSQMLLFYPMFAALFGACSLVGWTIIAAAETPIMLVLGIAVRVIPLFASWSLLKMSGTLPGQINSALTKFSQKPLGAFRTYAAEEAALRRAKYFGSQPRPYQLGRQFGQSLQDGKARRIADTQKYLEMAKLRGAASASNIRNRNGHVTRRGRQLTALQAQAMDYQRRIAKNTNDAEKGLYHYAKNEHDKDRLTAIDMANLTAADDLFIETSRGEKIRYDNAMSRQERINAAFNANSSQIFNSTKKPTEIPRTVNAEDLARYRRINAALEGDTLGTHWVGANAANDFAAQSKIARGKFDSYFTSLPPTQELYDRLFQLTSTNQIAHDIDPILSGMKALNMRGDTDLVTNVMRRIVETQQIKLGTHASQAIANFCMFDVKDSDPLIRRFGKYINLETARVYNEGQSKGKRKNDVVSFTEYITGQYDEYDDNGVLVKNAGHSKLSVAPLLMGTSLDGVERTAFENLDRSLRLAYTDESGNVDLEAFKKKRAEVNNAMLPAIINAALKFPSGSEQGINLASYITGLKLNADGTYTKRWEKAGDPLQGLTAQDFYNGTAIYLGAQVPSQILSLRTDTLNPIIEILADNFIDTVKAGKDPNANLPEYMDHISTDLSEYNNLVADLEKIEESDPEPVKQAKRDRNKPKLDKINAIRKKFAQTVFRGILQSSDTLEPIMSSKRSGASNASKKIVREFVGLGDKNLILRFIKWQNAQKEKETGEKSNRTKRNEKANPSDKPRSPQKPKAPRDRRPTEEEIEPPLEPAEPPVPSETGAGLDEPMGLYDDDQIDLMESSLEDTYQDHYVDTADTESYFQEILRYLKDANLSIMAQKWSEYYAHNPTATPSMLHDYLHDVLFADGNNF